MRVGLFVTCLVDLMRPRIGFAALELLEAAGCQVVVPATQTCCGQPAWNAGERAAARALAVKLLDEFEDCDYLVLPSGSCAAMVRCHYPQLVADDAALAARMAALAAKTFELTDFLVNVARLERLPRASRFVGEVTYHDSCSGLRELGIKQQPRALLGKCAHVKLKEMPAAEECCGFGGAFSASFGALSAAIAEKKCANIQASGAPVVVGGDLGCLLNIEGKLRRMGDETTQVLHIAEVLAGRGD
ncbi:Lactate utilization protein A [Sterolibacterium denitrificans]|uniref:Lactate utilization protein A n=1 Tax=Sterolibacterium denitrificans TaxID=157592 RepID=A0A7Z7HQJ0_9PROT|nr:(Fe-S)-binding protein [Sterolibacterium denitrificans]SMB24212.1 Lactate utilization protein A [Sterolibacterium denitrificans]